MEASKVRICAALSTTQLLSLIHILRNQPWDGFQDVLLWSSYENADQNRRMMMEMITAYDFTSAYELIGLKNPEPRRTGVLLWPFQSLLRHRHDARKLRCLLAPNVARSQSVEIWTDEPIHFPMRFLHGLLPRAVHVKFPHCFDLEDASSESYGRRMLDKAASEVTRARRLFWHCLPRPARHDYQHLPGHAR